MKRVLVIDDEAAIGRFVARLLSHEFEVVYAPSVAKGLAVIEGGVVDLVITDLEMPECNGLDGIPLIRALAPGIRIILMTGSRTEADRMWISERGADEYLFKPFDARTLTAAVARQLGSCATAPELAAPFRQRSP